MPFSFYTFDFIVVALMLVSFYAGFKKGAVVLFITYVAVILSAILTFILLEKGFEIWKSIYPDSGRNVKIYIMIALFFILYLAHIYGAFMLRNVLNWSIFTGTLDALVGGIISTYLWFSIFGINMFILCNCTNLDRCDIIKMAFFYPIFELNSKYIYSGMIQVWPYFQILAQDFSRIL